MTTPAQWTAIRERVFKEQGGKCWVCPKVHQSHETMHAHHAIIPKSHTNYKKKMALIDSPENIILICWQCHENHGDLTNWHRRWMFFSDKLDFGYDMQKWLNDLNLRADEYFLYIGKDERFINKEYRSNNKEENGK